MAADRPKFSKHLSHAGRQEFKRVVAILEERETYTAGDYAVVAVYAEVYARWVQAKKAIGDELMVTTQVTDNNGNLRSVTRLNPLSRLRRRVRRECSGY